jgi:hypothetical protein
MVKYKLLNFLLSTVDFIERCLFKTHSSVGTSLYVKVGNHNAQLTHVHFNGRAYCHKLITTHGIIIATDDHFFHASYEWKGETRNGTMTLCGIINLLESGNDVRVAYYNEEAKRKVYVKVTGIQELNEKRTVYDISISSSPRLYLANNFYVHNCITADTQVSVIDTEHGTEYTSVPVYELYYKNLQNPTWLDKLEYWLQRKINR